MSLDNLVGQTLAQYQLRELLGIGGMGAVYRAYQTNLKREVAVKIISPQLLMNTEAMARFIREAEVSAQLEHSNIVPIYDFGTQRGITYVVMRMLTGGSLSRRIEQRIEDGRPLISLGETADLLKQVASALDYAHSHGVVHRDIKPANIMFDNQGKPYVVDFGIAKITQGATSFTQTGMAMGTPNYMPPEQWRGEQPTPMADQYALAVMTYQLIAGRMPFEADSAFALMHKHINEQPTPLHVFRSDIPPAVIQVLNRAMAKDYRQRFQSCTAFAQAFESAIEGNKGNITGMFLFPVRPSQTGAIPISNRPYTPSNMPFSTQPKSNSKNWVVGGFVLTFMAVLIFIGILLAGNNGDSADSSSDATTTVSGIVMIITETPEISPTPFPPEITNTPLEIATETPALDSRSIAQTLVAEENNTTATSQASTATISAELTLIRQEQQLVNDTATASVWTETPSATVTFTPSNTPTATATSTPSTTLTATATSTSSSTPTRTRLEQFATANANALLTTTATPTRTRLEQFATANANSSAQQDDNTIIGIISSRDDLSILARIIEVADPIIAQTLISTDIPGLTLLAPNNDAFIRMALYFDVDLQFFLDEPELVTSLLRYHIVTGFFSLSDITVNDRGVILSALPDASIRVTVSDDGSVRLNIADVIEGNLSASNGRIHIIDDVIFTSILEEEILIAVSEWKSQN